MSSTRDSRVSKIRTYIHRTWSQIVLSDSNLTYFFTILQYLKFHAVAVNIAFLYANMCIITPTCLSSHRRLHGKWKIHWRSQRDICYECPKSNCWFLWRAHSGTLCSGGLYLTLIFRNVRYGCDIWIYWEM